MISLFVEKSVSVGLTVEPPGLPGLDLKQASGSAYGAEGVLHSAQHPAPLQAKHWGPLLSNELTHLVTRFAFSAEMHPTIKGLLASHAFPLHRFRWVRSILLRSHPLFCNYPLVIPRIAAAKLACLFIHLLIYVHIYCFMCFYLGQRSWALHP